MEYQYGTQGKLNKRVEDFYSLIQSLPVKEKIELIARISNSILIDKRREDTEQTPEEILAQSYGCFDSPRTADEIIEDIYSSRNFSDKNLQL